MKKEKIACNTYLLTFDNQKELCKTMLRFQEHYESPKFAGCVFSLKEYKEWYRGVNGKFSYYTDWNGFNIPSYVLKPFYEGQFKNITKREHKFLELFKNHYNNEQFYVICIHEEEPDSLFHELVHSMYYNVNKYKKEVDKVIDKYKHTKYVKEMVKHLKKLGYTKDVMYDEINAYTVCDDILETKAPVKMKESLKNLTDRYMKNYVH